MVRLLPRTLPSSLEALTTLALDLRWTWSHASDTFWRMIDADIWAQTRNPWFLLQDVPQRRLEELASDPAFRAEFTRLVTERRTQMDAPTWFTTNGARLQKERVVFFSMEFGLGEAIPVYAGGLGILAGDYLKTASDLGLPVVGVGILFQEGYFRQALDGAGHQYEAYPYNDPTTLPIQPVAARDGGWLRVAIELPGRTFWLRVWRAKVGRIDLFLLDGNEPINDPVDRGITSKLYGGTTETRLLQEIVLGIGGWRALEALGVAPSVAHLNEGHAAFVVVERARRQMETQHLTFYEALWATRAGNVFTTHTPVAAGFDAFHPELIAKYFPPFGSYLAELSITPHDFLALGRVHPDDDREPFNMTHLALRGSARANGVSRLHGAVSRRLFADLFPRWPEREVPVDHVTNGVHVPTWDSRAADSLWTTACGKERWTGSVDRLRDVIATVSDERLWSMRNAEREELLAYARRRLVSHLVRRGAEPSAASAVANVLDRNVLTLGFARRFAEYKRPNLLLRDPERFARLLTNDARPVQIVIAGKAHPADEEGKRLVADWLAFVSRTDVRHRAVFLEDYDMSLAAQLVTGADVWINTPRRPWEACGTSGMKVLVNGGLNLSELDGWWAEAYAPDVGWALGDDGAPDDARDAEALYALLEQEIAPEFYERDEQGLPRRWLTRVRASMARLAPAFSSNRMVIEYAERFYADAGDAYRSRIDHEGALARDLRTWETTLASHWSGVRVSAKEAIVRGPTIEFRAEVELGALTPEMVRVELVSDPIGDEPALPQPMREVSERDSSRPRVFETSVNTSRSPSDFTPRVVPLHRAARVPAECAFIAWAPNSFRRGR